jgi:butyrate kinase
MKRLLCLNPGSTSTRIAVFSGAEKEYLANVQHPNRELEALGGIQNQLDYRYRLIRKILAEAGLELSRLDAVVGRGGALRPMEGGIFSINEDMLRDCRESRYAEHPSNLGPQLAVMFATPYNLPSFIVDPPLINEFEDLARLSGLPSIERKSAFHALNEKAVARSIAEKLGRPLSELNIVTAHLGSGVSVTAQKKGRCVDTNYGSGGDGPFSPERCGRLPALNLVEAIAFDEEHSAAEWKQSFSKKSGLVSHLGTNDALEVERRLNAGDGRARDAYDGMAHFIAREIAAYCTVLDWRVDAIGLTGAIARSEYLSRAIIRELEFICPVHLYPGEFEMEALAAGGLRALSGEEQVKTY